MSESESNSPRIESLHISYPAEFGEHLEQLANEQYGGSKSGCIRAAVKDHSRSVAGEGEAAINQLKKQVETLSEAIEEVKELHQEPPQPNPNSQSQQEVGPVDPEAKNPDHQQLVYRAVKELDEQSCTINRLADELELSLAQLADVLEVLIDRDLVSSQSQDGEDVFQINGIHSEDNS